MADLDTRLGAPGAAEAVLEQAIALDRYSEEPYRRLMSLQGRGRRPDMVTETWRLLERRLGEIDVDPEPAALRLYRSLAVGGEVPTDPGPRVRIPS